MVSFFDWIWNHLGGISIVSCFCSLFTEDKRKDVYAFLSDATFDINDIGVLMNYKGT